MAFGVISDALLIMNITIEQINKRFIIIIDYKVETVFSRDTIIKNKNKRTRAIKGPL